MRKILLTILLISIFLGPMIVYSQEPSPPPIQERIKIKTDRGKSEINTKTDTKPSPYRMPIIVNKVHTPSNKATKQTADKKADQIKTWGNWGKGDVFNLFLAIFTGALVIFNILLWKTTKKSADAAKQSADAATKTADAIIGVEIPRFIVTDMNLICEDNATLIKVALTNRGRTDAVIIGECLTCEETPALTPKPRYPMHTQKVLDYGIVIESGQTHTISIENVISDAPTSPILWGYGYIRYRDFLGKIHRFGFVGGAGSHPKLTNGQSVAFHEEGPPAYTYNIYDEKQHF